MTRICFYRGCKTSDRRGDKAYYVSFTKPWVNIQRTLEWIKFCGRDEKKPEQVNRNTYVCHKHFPMCVDLDWKYNKALRPFPVSPEVEEQYKQEVIYSKETKFVRDVDMWNLAENSMKTYSRKRNKELQREQQDSLSKRLKVQDKSDQTELRTYSRKPRTIAETEQVFIKEEPPDESDFDPTFSNVSDCIVKVEPDFLAV